MVSDLYASVSRAYIDPGTGSMLFTVLIGLMSAGIYALRGLLIKLKFFQKKGKIDEKRIPFVIYTDSKRYWNVFKPICDEFERRKVMLSYYTQSNDDKALLEDYEYVNCEFIGEGNKGVAKMNFLNADIVLSTTPSLDVYQWKRSKNVKYYIHIPHACGDLTLYRMFGIDYYDAVLTSGNFQMKQIRDLESLRHLPNKDIKDCGITYFDIMKKRLDSCEKINNEIPVVLLAPSWGPSSILNRFGEKFINELMNTKYKVVIRPHPQSYISEKKIIESLTAKYPDIEWNKDNDNFDILNKADILISDFSGVIFDYALIFDKPVIYVNTKFDNSIYDAWWLKDIPWCFKVLPRIGIELNDDNIKNIGSIISDCLNSEKSKLVREEVRKEGWTNIGNSAKTIVDYLIDKQKGKI